MRHTAIIGAIIISTTVAHAINEDGLIFYFSFDQIDGDTVLSDAGQGINGKLEGDAQQAPGVKGMGIALNPDAADADPGKDFVRVAHVPEVSLNQAFTIATWGKSTSFADYRTLVSKTDSGAYAFTVEANFATAWVHVNGDYTHAGGKTKLDTDRWYHFALTYDGSDVVIYIDGNGDGKNTRPGPITENNSDLMIGAEPAGKDFDPAWPAWHGYLDEFYFYNRALAEDEIQALIDDALPVEPHGKLATRWGSLKAQ